MLLPTSQTKNSPSFIAGTRKLLPSNPNSLLRLNPATGAEIKMPAKGGQDVGVKAAWGRWRKVGGGRKE